ncbi:hypothetical protein [Roseomonas populi]|uniref:Uncharacterized protein n=1 Tax=Roseomonas populi TaxID=3121582 RepID=A0ABT1WZF4_9PROT|nr:hypothetical protein [Roseomonas pecuniae]MCR0981209.1 hypothetical protein [Roseomonas pecuniae]
MIRRPALPTGRFLRTGTALLPLVLAVPSVGAAQDAPGTPFDTRRDPGFGDARPTLALLLARAAPTPRGP